MIINSEIMKNNDRKLRNRKRVHIDIGQFVIKCIVYVCIYYKKQLCLINHNSCYFNQEIEMYIKHKY